MNMNILVKEMSLFSVNILLNSQQVWIRNQVDHVESKWKSDPIHQIQPNHMGFQPQLTKTSRSSTKALFGKKEFFFTKFLKLVWKCLCNRTFHVFLFFIYVNIQILRLFLPIRDSLKIFKKKKISRFTLKVCTGKN
jgi:hypothetical protein